MRRRQQCSSALAESGDRLCVAACDAEAFPKTHCVRSRGFREVLAAIRQRSAARAFCNRKPVALFSKPLRRVRKRTLPILPFLLHDNAGVAADAIVVLCQFWGETILKKTTFLAFALFLGGCVANGPIYQDA